MEKGCNDDFKTRKIFKIGWKLQEKIAYKGKMVTLCDGNGLRQNVPKEDTKLEADHEDSVFSSKFDSGMDLTYCQVKLLGFQSTYYQGSDR